MTGVWHVVVAIKPMEGNFAANALKHGVAGLNIDESRVSACGDDDGVSRSRKTGASDIVGGFGFHKEDATMHSAPGVAGRFPSNVVLGHLCGCRRLGTKKVKGITGTLNGSWRKGHQYSGGWSGAEKEELGGKVGFADEDGNEMVENWECAEGCPAKMMDGQSGITTTKRIEKPCDCGGNTWGGTFQTKRGARGHSDTGGASRFFKQVGEQK